MAGIDDLKDQLRERGQALWERVQESSTYNNLREKYESSPPLVQRAMIGGLIALVLLLLASIPYSYLDSASQHVADFEDHRTLIRQLLKAVRSSQEQSPFPSGPTAAIIKPQIENALKGANLIPDQIAGIDEAPILGAENLVPKTIQQAGISVRVKKLNLRQVVDIGYDLNRLHAAIKLVNIEVREVATMKNYYDVDYGLISFIIPGAGGGSAPGGRRDDE
jgi:hypothetical protein